METVWSKNSVYLLSVFTLICDQSVLISKYLFKVHNNDTRKTKIEVALVTSLMKSKQSIPHQEKEKPANQSNHKDP